MTLVTSRIIRVTIEGLIVTAKQRYCPAHGFQIIPPPSRCATVDEQVRISAAQFVPISKITLYVQVFGHPLPVGRVISAPKV